MMKLKSSLFITLAAFMTLVGSAASYGDVLSVTPGTISVGPGVNFDVGTAGGVTHPADSFLLFENGPFILPVAQPLDDVGTVGPVIGSPAGGYFPGTPGVLAAGTLTETFVLHSSNPIIGPGLAGYGGTIIFTSWERIIGLQYFDPNLVFGNGTIGKAVAYDPLSGINNPAVFFGTPFYSHLTLLNPFTLSWTFFNAPNTTQSIRIFTAVPEPGTYLFLGSCLAVVVFLARKKARQVA